MGAAVDSDQPECRTVPEGPLEVVQETPVNVAPHIDPVGEAAVEAIESGRRELNTLVVIRGGDPVLGDDDRNMVRQFPGPPNRRGAPKQSVV